jgi:phasin
MVSLRALNRYGQCSPIPGAYGLALPHLSLRILIQNNFRARACATIKQKNKPRESAMSTEQLKVPHEMRAVAERSIERAKRAFDTYIRVTQEAVGAVELCVESGQVGAQEVGIRAMHFALRNAVTAFEFAQKIVQAKSISEFIRLLNDYLQSQMQIMSDQVKDLGETLSWTAADSIKDRKSGPLSS